MNTVKWRTGILTISWRLAKIRKGDASRKRFARRKPNYFLALGATRTNIGVDGSAMRTFGRADAFGSRE